ncbi:MAG: HPr family phosphocarrier protein [Nitrospinota bacterium]|nr:HPr family phosphocarrier protein [Nitrospinota bacterium]
MKRNDDAESGQDPAQEERDSLHLIISEEAFREPLQVNAAPFLQLASYLIHLNTPENFTSKFYFNLMNEAGNFETFLDDYGARNNRTWYFFSELVASVRNFAVASFELSHVVNRYQDYFPNHSADDSEEFLQHGAEVLNYIGKIQKALIEEAIKEMERLGCRIEGTDADPKAFQEIEKQVKLPRNISMNQYTTSESRIMQIVESYRKIAIKVRREKYGNKPDPAELSQMIPVRINETMVKILENSLHNIQSEYDTHVRHTNIESSDPDLQRFRAYISVPMHLMEMARWIIHFYERHENEIHSDESKDRISNIVDKNFVLKLLSHFAFFYTHKFMQEGKPIAEKIMSRFMRKSRITLPIPKPKGFHARPAYYITLVVEEHGTDVFMIVGDRKFDCRSVLDLLEGGGHTADMESETVDFEGDERTLKDLTILAENNYCEDETIPKELNYIRVARNIVT